MYDACNTCAIVTLMQVFVVQSERDMKKYVEVYALYIFGIEWHRSGAWIIGCVYRKITRAK